jgi:hypothetical protein
MGDVLDQSEIDALLASVGGDEDDDAGGEAAVATSGGGGDEAAPGGGHGGGGGGGHGGGGGGHSLPYRNPFEHASVSTYEFKRPERVSKDHIRALNSIHSGIRGAPCPCSGPGPARQTPHANTSPRGNTD